MADPLCTIHGMSMSDCLTSSSVADITGIYEGTAYQQTVPTSVFPSTLQNSINNCTNDADCNVISYDPMSDAATGFKAAGYTIDTFNTTAENNVVLVKKTAPTPVSLITPPGYKFEQYAVENWGGNPSPPGASTNIMSQPAQYSDQDSCAQACDNLSGCLGFDFNPVNSACFFFNGVGANVFSDSYVGFYKTNIPKTASGTNPTGSNFTNIEAGCNISACNSNIASLAATVGLSGFSTAEIKACNMCPVRSLYLNSPYVVTNEIGTSTTYNNLQSAITAISYVSPANIATRIPINTSGTITSYIYPSCTSACTITPTTSETFYTITGSLFNGGVHQLLPVNYVNNGYVVMSPKNEYIVANQNGTISTTSSPLVKYSSDYNKSIFILS